MEEDLRAELQQLSPDGFGDMWASIAVMEVTNLTNAWLDYQQFLIHTLQLFAVHDRYNGHVPRKQFMMNNTFGIPPDA